MIVEQSQRYDSLGQAYRRAHSPDPRIAALIEDALGDAVSVINVGAGAGAYESPTRKVVAVDPSAVMLRQRAADAAPAVRGRAEALPFMDASVDAATAFMSVHHWTDQKKGLRELRRIARKRVVILTYVPHTCDANAAWLASEYFPQIGRMMEVVFPGLGVYEECLGPSELRLVPIPADCTALCLDAYWARPESYLDPSVRSAIFWFKELDAEALATGLRRLEEDLRSGLWDARFGHLRAQRELDAGLRIVASHGDRS